jgi:hypothetical protein
MRSSCISSARKHGRGLGSAWPTTSGLAGSLEDEYPTYLRGREATTALPHSLGLTATLVIRQDSLGWGNATRECVGLAVGQSAGAGWDAVIGGLTRPHFGNAEMAAEIEMGRRLRALLVTCDQDGKMGAEKGEHKYQ